MKICLCINGRPHEGGMTTSVNEYADALRKLKHQVDVITIFGCSSYRKVKPNLVKKTDKLFKNRPSLTLIIYLISKLVLGFHLYKYFLFKKYDVIFAMDFSAVNIARPLKKVFGVPVLHFYFGGIAELLDQGKLRYNSWITDYFLKEEKISIKNADLIITSPALVPNIKQASQIVPPIFLIRSTVNPEKFYPDANKRKNYREKLKITPEKFVLLFTGRLDPRKGIKYPALAINELLKKGFNNFLLLYAGEGPEKNFLENFIKENNLSGYIKILGAVSHHEIPDLYRAADCLLFTSIQQHGIQEPISISPLEAMASETPVIAFDLKDIASEKKILINEKNCFLVTEKDYLALSETILKLYRNKELREKISNQGREEIFQGGWTPDEIIDSILKTISGSKF